MLSNEGFYNIRQRHQINEQKAMGAVDPRRRAEAQHEVQNRDRPYES